ncbi:MAG: AtpZ/AtpI family protein [Rhodospirillum sp.]|nr:AtpZ/AtpI family protein [Rhodospirillum sp.]MCF8491065.1 AtpZ/AtpI family protein [Rhodospirillum sp.]MCF8500209.1 AtpZ/AtpI family protein [Rhodospirillum sp.]
MADRGSNGDIPPSLEDISERLGRLRPASGRDERGGAGSTGPQRVSGLGIGMRISVELVVTVAVGTALGYGIDSWLGTMPIFLIVFLLFGGAAGVMNAYRVVKGLDESVGLGGAVARKENAEGKKDRG